MSACCEINSNARTQNVLGGFAYVVAYFVAGGFSEFLS